MAAPRPCGRPGCGAVTEGRYCGRHAKSEARKAEAARGSAAKRGYGRRWQRERKAFLALNPLCRHCQADGRVTASMVVDHIVPHRGDRALFWRRSNWQALCKSCHDTKTATVDRRGGQG